MHGYLVHAIAFTPHVPRVLPHAPRAVGASLVPLRAPPSSSDLIAAHPHQLLRRRHSVPTLFLDQADNLAGPLFGPLAPALWSCH